MIKGLADLLLLAHTDGDNQRIDDAERRNQRVNKGCHIALGEQRIVCRLAQRRQLAVGQGNDRRTGFFGLLKCFERALGIALEADTEHDIAFAYTQNLLKNLTDAVGVNQLDIIEHQIEIEADEAGQRCR